MVHIFPLNCSLFCPKSTIFLINMVIERAVSWNNNPAVTSVHLGEPVSCSSCQKVCCYTVPGRQHLVTSLLILFLCQTPSWAKPRKWDSRSLSLSFSLNLVDWTECKNWQVWQQLPNCEASCLCHPIALRINLHDSLSSYPHAASNQLAS